MILALLYFGIIIAVIISPVRELAPLEKLEDESTLSTGVDEVKDRSLGNSQDYNP